MFERFTEQARRVVFFARAEASQLGSTRIDTEHLLLGLIRDGKALTNRLFADAGIARDDIRDEVLRRVPARSKTSASPEIPFSAAAQRVLQHSAEEADRLLHDFLGTEHLLLGLLSEEGSVAADVLTSRGLRLDRMREHTVKLLSDRMRPGHPGPYLARWFEEFLDGQVIDETNLRGLYGFELTRPVGNRDELIHLLRDQAGVSIMREQYDTPALVVRRR